MNLGGHETPLDFIDRCAGKGTLIADDLDATLRREVQSLAIWWNGQDPPPTGIRFVAREVYRHLISAFTGAPPPSPTA
ncbi:hypothetical protein OHA98_20375 [Streptomyces sp. NBC_00654]|uniref:hypothetical protein n=1 Tax=Streptomyces sp. NBC_00654 TaxID=2975799 RepID=UPI0022579625|nr:hypothetical protein [Streptomyces sp. NBC_00654]MCX4967106.1 hypothetical protein [Streptomyces sp. NBC_00654]